MSDSTSRRIRIDLNTVTERAIHDAIQKVEELEADVRLTDAITLLQEAKDKVSDFTDEVEEVLKTERNIELVGSFAKHYEEEKGSPVPKDIILSFFNA